MSDTITTHPIRVLIVDDSDDQRHLLRRHFEMAGCDVDDAESAESALSAYSANTPDLVVIDLILPGMTGWELANRIREDQPDCSIVITSVLDTEDYPQASANLPKPVTGASVRDVLRRCLPEWTTP